MSFPVEWLMARIPRNGLPKQAEYVRDSAKSQLYFVRHLNDMKIQVIENTLDTKNSTPGRADKQLMEKIWIQIYEIQTPHEAEQMIELGVDHIGSVVQFMDNWKIPDIKDAIRVKEGTTVKTALIPLYSDPDMIYRTADYYEPDILHFCESLTDAGGVRKYIGDLIKLQEGFRKRFPEMKIMRTIPIAPKGKADLVPSLELAKTFSTVSDYFLTDTLIVGGDGAQIEKQPEEGFVGITGKTCDWEMAKKLVNQSAVPVILAGGISPENVCEGILDVKPAGVDSCSHTNLSDHRGNPVRFKKDPEKVKRLIEAVRRAENELNDGNKEDDTSHVRMQ